MTRKIYLSEKEVLELERMDSSELAGFVFRAGTNKAGETMTALLRSYRISCTVANAAWKLVQELDGPEGVPSVETMERLREALHLYSPGNFPVAPMTLAYGCQLLEETYTYMAQWGPDNMAAAMLEKLYERILAFRGRLLGM